MPDFLPLVLSAAWLNGAIAGAIVGALVGLGLWAYQKKSAERSTAADAAREAGLAAQSERAEELPAELDGVAILRAGRAHRFTAVARGERDGRAFTTFGLTFRTGGRHTPTTRRYVGVHLPTAGSDPLHAVSLPEGAPEGILEAFGYAPVDAPRTVRANDAEAAAAWAARPDLLEAAGEDALAETGPAGLTLLVPGEPDDAETLESAIDRALRAAG